MLAIEVAFLTGRYVATAYNSRKDAEWPPHPARLFSAFVAAHFAPGDSSQADLAAERAAIEWLEQQGPPAIAASEADVRDVVTVFVPVNDVALTNVEDEWMAVTATEAALVAARASGDKKTVDRLARQADKALETYKKAVVRATAKPTVTANPTLGRRVLPEFRTRQPRTFPSVAPRDPRVTFIWEAATPDAATLRAIEALISRVVRLGHSSSLVSTRITSAPSPATWRPADSGQFSLRVVQAGQLVALEESYARHHETEPRVLPAIHQPYERATQLSPAEVAHSLFSNEWLVLRRVGGPQLPMTAAAGVARAIRRTLMSFADEPVSELLSGHQPDGGPATTPHLAIVPLAFVAHEHATGGLAGVALVFPSGTPEEQRRAVYSAVARWESGFRQEDEEAPAIELHLGAAGVWRLERVEFGAVQSSLRPATWCAPSREWRSVTPVALDRNPGDLHSRDRGKQALAIEEATESVRRSCGRVGLPEPIRVVILPAAPWAGAAKARAYPAYPGEPGRAQRVLTHVLIEFDRAVAGPVLLGSGRYVGLGLFRPVHRHV